MNFEKKLLKRKTLKTKFKNREKIFGSWVSFRDQGISETFAMSGFDFVAIDMEHTTINLNDANRIITSVQSEGSICLPRPVSHNNDFIKPLLEAGADGMIIQMVETPEETNKLINSLYFPPIGNRSYGVNRAHSYGLQFNDYINSWNESGILIIQIESIKGVNNIDKILKTPGIDAVMIGPYDISGSLGVPGDINHLKVKEAASHVINECVSAGISCATQISDVSQKNIMKTFEEGYNSIILSSDLFIISDWSANMKKIINELKNKYL